MNTAFNDVPEANVHIWEASAAVMALSSLLHWYHFRRRKFLLGIYLGYRPPFGWTRCVDQFFFLRLDFHPASFGGFEIAGHWEPFWTAISYTALGIPAIHYLIHRESLKARFGTYSLVPYLVVIPVAILFCEGLWGCVILRVQNYNWRPERLVWMKPWSNSLILEPLMLILPIFLCEPGGGGAEVHGIWLSASNLGREGGRDAGVEWEVGVVFGWVLCCADGALWHGGVYGGFPQLVTAVDRGTANYFLVSLEF